MKIIKGKPLADLTTFRIGGKARFFCEVGNKEELKEAVDFAKEKNAQVFVLGGGSNILVSDKGFDGSVIKINIKGIETASTKNVSVGARPDDFIYIRAGAGENWDDFVAWTVARGYGGLENLSLISGTAGAAPVQNIGAYGVEVGDLIESVEVFDTKEGAFKNLSRNECHFAYRDSLFKHEKGRHIIVSVLFGLKKDSKPDFSYKDLQEYFKGNAAPSTAAVRDAVIAIRTAKLPDVKKVGTAGSFFKNPILSKEKFVELKGKYPELPSFPEADGRIKIPLAWIIDKACGLKGKRSGEAGIHDTQALVIVNYGAASFEEVEKVATEIEKQVKEKTGIDIEREVEMV
jgi:UDP-N-acetylmuramate dehydrogenase